jgi:hypothetical protein
VTWMEFDEVGLARNAGKNLWHQQSMGKVYSSFLNSDKKLCTYIYICVCVYIYIYVYLLICEVLAVRCNATCFSRPVLTSLSNTLPSSTRTEYEDIRLLQNVGTSLPIYVMSIQEDHFVNADRSGNLKYHSTLLK